jgi:hypothetical protein
MVRAAGGPGTNYYGLSNSGCDGTYALPIHSMGSDTSVDEMRANPEGSCLMVCREFFSMAIGFSHGKVQAVYNQLLKWERLGPPERVFRQRDAVALETTKAAIQQVAKSIADTSPKNPDTLEMPFFQKLLLYRILLAENSKHNLFPTGIPSSRTFYRALKGLPHIVFHRHKEFGRCTRCALLTAIYLNVHLPTRKRQLALTAFFDHQIWVKLERQVYYDVRALAKQELKRVMSIGMDAMDQNTSRLPHIMRNVCPTSLKDAELPRMKIVSVLNHGRGTYVFAVPPGEQHGANMTCSILLKSISYGFERFGAEQRPVFLHLQMDNTSGENKNHTTLRFLAWLIFKGVFKEIELQFLPVKHTHDDYDVTHATMGVAFANSTFSTVSEMADIAVGALSNSCEQLRQAHCAAAGHYDSIARSSSSTRRESIFSTDWGGEKTAMLSTSETAEEVRFDKLYSQWDIKTWLETASEQPAAETIRLENCRSFLLRMESDTQAKSRAKANSSSSPNQKGVALWATMDMHQSMEADPVCTFFWGENLLKEAPGVSYNSQEGWQRLGEWPLLSISVRSINFNHFSGLNFIIIIPIHQTLYLLADEVLTTDQFAAASADIKSREKQKSLQHRQRRAESAKKVIAVCTHTSNLILFCLPVCLSVYLSICLSVYLSV